jgi:hypothetical protein
MTPKVYASAVVTMLALIGCWQPQSQPSSGSPGALNCTPNNCKVAVVITGDCTNAANITLNPDQLPVPKANHHIKIDWDIQTAGFKWVAAPGGITFTTPPLPPAGEFTNPHDNGSKYDLTDENTATTRTPYKYGVHLRQDNGTLCAVKDPFIINGD